MKLPPSSLLGSIAIAGLPLLSASAVNSAFDSKAALEHHHADTGILAIQTEHDEFPFHRDLQSTCPDTCSSALCDCVSKYGYAEPCALELHSVCTEQTLSNCVSEDYVFYYQNVYCPFAACRVGGESYETCACDSYVDFCNIYQNKEGYERDTKTLKYCSIAVCCLGKTDDMGRETCLGGSFKNNLETAGNTAGNLLVSAYSKGLAVSLAISTFAWLMIS